MANTKQAKKRAQQSETRRAHNASMRSMFRTYIKKVFAMVEKKDRAGAEAAYKTAVSVIDKMASKGIIHKNKASRHKQRLSKHVTGIPA